MKESAFHDRQSLSQSALLQIRESIKNLFPNRECFALIRPMTDEHQLTKLDTISPDQLRPQFVEVRFVSNNPILRTVA